MLLVKEIKKYFFVDAFASITETEAAQAYDMWSTTYDDQPDNLMLALDEEIFSKLLESISLENKTVADIGCGTGRHWQKIIDKMPAILTGYDVSEGMLKKLQQKFPGAVTHQISNNLFTDLPAASVDVIVSTLTIAHLENLDESLEAWFRILRPNGDIIITDFHPAALANGGKRTFQKGSKQVTVKNFIHPVESIKQTGYRHGFYVVQEEEIKISGQYKHFYENKNAMHVFEKFNGTPIIYGLHLKSC